MFLGIFFIAIGVVLIIIEATKSGIKTGYQLYRDKHDE